MRVYDKFAWFYAKGPYPQYSERMADILPSLLERFRSRPKVILDLACGEGTFAVAMAKKGFQVMGVDQSSQMIRLARERAKRENAKVKFSVQDMRSLSYKEKFDLVTCWYDSLNYLPESTDLESTFRGVYRALTREGLFIFDMNTIYGLAVKWQRHPCFVQQDTPEMFEVHRHEYDFEKNLATLVITGFIKRGKRWVRVDEKHHERGYPLDEIRKCLRKSGLRELACWGSLEEMSEPRPDSGRAYFLTRKQMR